VAPSVSFDRIADRYDETRGGLERGAEIARAIEPFVAAAEWLLEVGIGTGAVANGFVERGRTVLGIDLSAEMLALAKARVGDRVARANAQALPVAGDSVPAAYVVWVLHVVAEPQAVVAECARALQRGGRLVVNAGRPRSETGDMTPFDAQLAPLREARLNDDRAESVCRWAAAAGLVLAAHAERVGEFELSPAQLARNIERRSFSYTLDLDDATWAAQIQPVIDGLRALPNPDKPRPCRHTDHLLVFEKD